MNNKSRIILANTLLVTLGFGNIGTAFQVLETKKRKEKKRKFSSESKIETRKSSWGQRYAKLS